MNTFFLKIFIRNLSRKGLYPIINISGLAIGLTVVLLICAFIFNEYSFDKSFTHHQRIYRANAYMTSVMAGETLPVSSNGLASAVKDEVPEVEVAVRLLLQQSVVKVGDIPFKIEKFCWADEEFFRLFDTPFIYGSPEEVFSRPNTVAIAESQAKIFFGDRNPLGETLWVDNQQQMEVSAVYRDFPANSSIDFQMTGHYKSSYQSQINEPNWSGFMVETFLLMAPGTNVSFAEAKMQQVVEKNIGGSFYDVKLQPLSKIHLHSKGFSWNGFTGNYGDIGQVKMFSLLAIIILLIACINYINLSTARAQKRAKEIGVSKTIGAKRREIIWRLYAETGMTTFLSFAVAVVLTLMALPVFNRILGQNIHPEIFLNVKFLVGMLLVYLSTSVITASYPALYLSGFAPMTVIRQSAFTKGSSHALVRKGLSVVQFSVAVILIAWVIIIHAQMNYVNKKDIGYNVQNMIGIPITNSSELDALKNDYLAQASVSAVAFSQAFPFGIGNVGGMFKSLAEMYEGRKNNIMENTVAFFSSQVTYEIIDMLRLELIAGNALPARRSPGDTIANIVINRKTVEFLETTPEEIIGKRIPTDVIGIPFYVCGVVEDFHFQSLHEPIAPFGFYDASFNNYGYLLLKVKEGNMSQQLRVYEEIFKRHFPNNIFEVQFPDLLLGKAYEGDRRTGIVVLIFSILAILVACMGVFGLSAFMAEQRTKEIGIRKVFGASVVSIVRLFTDNYLRLLALSLLIALPVAWWMGGKYLENFAYRISLSWWIFAAAALITVALTLFTVCWQAIRAATANPVDAIMKCD